VTHFRFTQEPEITVEANPDDLTPQVLKHYREMGINRLSLGVQSLCDRELAFLGRRHDASKALQALAWARAAGFANLGIDLIYGLPGQTLEEWRKTLEIALSFRPEHFSCYQLTVAEGRPWPAGRQKGSFNLFRKRRSGNFSCSLRNSWKTGAISITKFPTSPGDQKTGPATTANTGITRPIWGWVPRPTPI
jgi:coproporphyrinogen III oxidase-like Fe-S oxidoreductase